MPHIIPLKNLSKHHLKQVGLQAHQLGLFHDHKLPVPNLFVVTSAITHEFFQSAGLTEEIEPLLKHLNLLKPQDIALASTNIHHLIKKHQIPDKLALQLVKSYNSLGRNSWVELSISTSENILPARILDIFYEQPIRAKGDANFLEAIKSVWGLLFSPEVLAYRHRHDLDQHQLDVAIVVTQIPNVEVSGVMSTIDELHENKHLINIEAVWGLYDELLTGQADADFYQVEKQSWRIDQIHTAKQNYYRPAHNPDHRKRLIWRKPTKQKLTEPEIAQLAQLGHQVANLLFFPQRIYWLKSGSQFWLANAEKIELDIHSHEQTYTATNKLSQGIGISPGLVSGRIRHLSKVDPHHQLKDSDIVVIEHLNDETVEAIRMAAGVIAVHGNYSAHAAVLLRDSAIPAVGDVLNGQNRFKEGDKVTINGLSGEVFAGAINKPIYPVSNTYSTALTTVTKTFAYLDSIISGIDLTNEAIDGVMGADCHELVKTFNLHPRVITSEKNTHDFGNQLTTNLQQICQHAGQRPVWYTLLNMDRRSRTKLELAAEYEIDTSDNFSYKGLDFLLDHPKWLEYELGLFYGVKAQQEHLNLVVPGVKSSAQLRRFEKYLKSQQLAKGYWVETAVPVGILEIEQLASKAVTGIIIYLDELVSNLYLQDLDHLLERGFSIRNAPALTELLIQLGKQASQQQLQLIVVQNQIELNTHLLHDLVSFGLYGLSCKQERLVALKHDLASAEHWHVGRGAKQVVS